MFRSQKSIGVYHRFGNVSQVLLTKPSKILMVLRMVCLTIQVTGLEEKNVITSLLRPAAPCVHRRSPYCNKDASFWWEATGAVLRLTRGLQYAEEESGSVVP